MRGRSNAYRSRLQKQSGVAKRYAAPATILGGDAQGSYRFFRTESKAAAKKLYCDYMKINICILFYAVTALVSMISTSAHPYTAPPAGIDIDETRTIIQRTARPVDCIAVPVEDAIVLLDRVALSKYGSKAAVLLNSARTQQKKSPRERGLEYRCALVAENLSPQAMRVVLEQLEVGDAAVIVQSTGQLAPNVSIRYFGMRCGAACGRGIITVLLPNQSRPFLHLDWWVS